MVKLLYFIVFVLISLVAFGTFRQSIWFPYEDFKWESVREIFLKPYFMLYGEVYADIIWRQYLTPPLSPRSCLNRNVIYVFDKLLKTFVPRPGLRAPLSSYLEVV